MLGTSSKEEAINIMLASIGADPVDTIDPTNDVDVANALKILDKTGRMIQLKGWDFNTFPITVRPDFNDDNKIRWDDSWLQWKATNGQTYIKRNGYMYDMQGQTFAFSAPVDFTVLIAADFEDMPEAFREYVAIKAAYDFQSIFMGDQNISQDLQMELMQAHEGIVRYEVAMGDYNMLRLSGISSSLARR